MSTPIWVPKPQTRKSAPDYVIDQIRDALLKKRLHPGDKLPPESEMVDLFGLSRGSVRQAMKSLETLGVITIRPGDGTYVNTSLSENHLNPLIFALLISTPSMKEISDTRYALERDIVELLLADEKLISQTIPLLEENLREHQRLIDTHASTEELVQNDQHFHRILSHGCGNTVMQTIYDYVLDSFEHQMILTTSRQSEAEGNNVTIRDHEKILNALKNRNFSEAKQAIQDSMSSWTSFM